MVLLIISAVIVIAIVVIYLFYRAPYLPDNGIEYPVHINVPQVWIYSKEQNELNLGSDIELSNSRNNRGTINNRLSGENNISEVTKRRIIKGVTVDEFGNPI